MGTGGSGLESDHYLDDPRWRVAERVSDAARRRFPADILAVAVHGPLAHGDDGGGDGEVSLLLALLP